MKDYVDGELNFLREIVDTINRFQQEDERDLKKLKLTQRFLIAADVVFATALLLLIQRMHLKRKA